MVKNVLSTAFFGFFFFVVVITAQRKKELNLKCVQIRKENQSRFDVLLLYLSFKNSYLFLLLQLLSRHEEVTLEARREKRKFIKFSFRGFVIEFYELFHFNCGLVRE